MKVKKDSLKHEGYVGAHLQEMLRSYPFRRGMGKTTLIRQFMTEEEAERIKQMMSLITDNQFSSSQPSTQTQLIPAEYSYANFQQTLFAKATIQEPQEDNDYVLINQDEINHCAAESDKKTQCSIM